MLAETVETSMFEALAETAAHTLGVPWASITIVDGNRVAVKASHGFARAESSVGSERIAGNDLVTLHDVLVVEDAANDERSLRALDAFGTPQARAYAGVPIVASDGTFFGALYVFDRDPRKFSAGQIRTLRSLAGLSARQLEVHVALFEANAVRRELSTIIGASPLAICTLDLEGCVWSFSAAAEQLFGYPAADVVGRFPPWIPGGRNNRDYREMMSAARRGATYLNQRARRQRADGNYVDIRISAAPMFADDGSVMGLVSMSESVEALERVERRLHLFEMAVCKASDAVFVTSSLPVADPNIVWVNEAFSEMFGFGEDEIVGKPVSSLRSVDIDPRLTEEITRARRQRLPVRGRMAYRRSDGQTFWCESSLSPVIEEDGRCDNWVIIARDVTEQRRTQRMQTDRGEILEMIAADAPLERIFAALVASAERARPGAGALVRLRRGDLLYRVAAGSVLEGQGQSDGAIGIDDTSSPCGRAITEGEQVAIDGAWSSPIRGTTGDAVGTFAMIAASGVSPSRTDLRLGVEFGRLAGLAIERHEDREQLEFLALHDALTGLPNRKLIGLRLDAAIAAAEKRGRHVALGLIDLDRFKVVNDSLGHAVGDQLLRDVATRLTESVRPGDTLARLGGDEFVLLIDDLASREDALEIADRVLLSLVPSFNCAGQEVFVRASMGLSTYPADATDASGLLAIGDAAMYEAKSQGRVVGFHNRRDDVAGIARIALETSLNHALEKREFEVLFQPQVELRTREIRGAEALLRWNHPTHGLMLPDTFVRLAEDTGLIVAIGAWVLEEACRFARQWQDEGFDRFVSVNVSARQFDQPEFVELVTQTLVKTGLEPNRLHLELTEGLVMRSPEKAAATLVELKALGVKIVIDDFGTGYSSFNYLKRFPLDALKIDRLFVRDIGFGSRAPNDEAIVRAIVGVARALDLKIVAEGVENEDQVAFLRAIGVPLAQGFLFAPGLRPASALRWTKTASRR